MASSIPLRLAPPPPQHLRDTISRAMANYGAALCQMPHVEPDALRHPPPEGWDGIDVITLKARGKSDDAIEFVRHLPYLAHGTYMTMNIKSIDIGQGETWPAYAEAFIETPSYVIWIGQQDTRDGHFLLLDTLHGTITEYATLDTTLCLPNDEYESLALSDKWMAHATLNAEEWFNNERRKIEQLEYMTVPGHWPTFLFQAKPSEDEVKQNAIYGETEDDERDWLDSDEGTESDDSDAAGSDDADEVTMEEVQDLGREDVALSIPSNTTVAVTSDTAEQAPESPSTLHPTPYQVPPPDAERPEVSQVFTIYTRNGWFTDSWDREKCRAELIQWQEEKLAAQREAKKAEDRAKGPESEATQKAKLEQHRRIKRMVEEKRERERAQQ